MLVVKFALVGAVLVLSIDKIYRPEQHSARNTVRFVRRTRYWKTASFSNCKSSAPTFRTGLLGWKCLYLLDTSGSPRRRRILLSGRFSGFLTTKLYRWHIPTTNTITEREKRKPIISISVLKLKDRTTLKIFLSIIWTKNYFINNGKILAKCSLYLYRMYHK